MEGILCVCNRLQNSPLQDKRKHPAIIPKDNYISKLIARYYHSIRGHSGLGHTLSLIRKKFWIIHARSWLRRILSACVHCRKRQAAEGQQKLWPQTTSYSCVQDLPSPRVPSLKRNAILDKDGDTCNTWLTCSGDGGFNNTSPRSSKGRNGIILPAILQLATSYYCWMKKNREVPSRLGEPRAPKDTSLAADWATLVK